MFEIFWEALAGTSSSQESRKFLDSFISDVEHVMLAKRLAIALMLAKGYSYREIENTLKVSTATVMGVSIRYKTGGKGLDPALNRILKNEKFTDFLDNIEEFLIMISGPAKTGSTRHEARVKAGKELYKRRKKRSFL